MQLHLVTTLGAAEILGVHPATVTRWVASGRIKPVHKGTGLRGAFLFRAEELSKLRADLDLEARAAAETESA